VAAPTTSTLDNFTRPNSTGLGPNWTQMVAPDEPLPNILSNQAINSSPGTVNSGYWNVTTFASDAETWYLWDGTKGVPAEVDCWCRVGGTLPTSGDASPTIGYDVNFNASTGALALLKSNGSGGVTQIGSTVSGLTGMTGIWLHVGATGAGQVLTGYTWDGSEWVLQITQSDATFTAAGYCAFEFGNTTPVAAMTSFGGGSITPPYLAFFEEGRRVNLAYEGPGKLIGVG
jgi:hypothetical protein